MLLDVHLNVDFDVVPFSFERCLDLTNESFGDLVCGFTEDAGLEVLLGLILTTGKLVDSVLDGVHDASFHRRFHYTPCNLREISHQIYQNSSAGRAAAVAHSVAPPAGS